jgi:hypothetical protein
MDSLPMSVLVEKYIESLNAKEYKAYLIAKSHLGSSFSIEKSVGFLQWLKTKKTNI